MQVSQVAASGEALQGLSPAARPPSLPAGFERVAPISDSPSLLCPGFADVCMEERKLGTSSQGMKGGQLVKCVVLEHSRGAWP